MSTVFESAKPSQFLRCEGFAALPGATPKDWVKAGVDKLILACTKQSILSEIVKYLCASRPPQGLIVLVQEGLGRFIPTIQITTDIPTTALAMDIEAQILFAGQDDGMVEVYSLKNDEFSREWGFSAHSMGISCIMLTEDGQALITCSLDRKLKVWDRSKRTMLASIQIGQAGICSILSRQCLSIFPGPDILIGSFDSNIYGVRLKDDSGQRYDPHVVQQLPPAHTGSIQCICTSEDPSAHRSAAHDAQLHRTRPRLFTASFDRTVGVWEGVPRLAADGGYVTEPRLVGRLMDHAGTVRCLLWLPARGELLSGGADGRITLWRLEAVGFRPLASVQAHDLAVARMALAESGRVVSVGDDSCVRTWAFDDPP